MSKLIDNDNETLEKLKKYRSDLKWFQDNYRILKESYKGEYVAIENRNVIAHDMDLQNLLKRLNNKDTSEILIEFINENKVMYVL